MSSHAPQMAAALSTGLPSYTSPSLVEQYTRPKSQIKQISFTYNSSPSSALSAAQSGAAAPSHASGGHTSPPLQPTKVEQQSTQQEVSQAPPTPTSMSNGASATSSAASVPAPALALDLDLAPVSDYSSTAECGPTFSGSYGQHQPSITSTSSLFGGTSSAFAAKMGDSPSQASRPVNFSHAEQESAVPEDTTITIRVPARSLDPYVAPTRGDLSPRPFATDPLHPVNSPYTTALLLGDYGSPRASTSTTLFNHNHLPPRKLTESFARTRLADDAEQDSALDPVYGYQATETEIEAFKHTAAERADRAARAEAKLAERARVRAHYLALRAPPIVTTPAGMYRPLADAVRYPRALARPQQQSGPPRPSRRLPQPHKVQNMATQSRFKRALAASLFPDDAQPERYIDLSHLPTFFNLLSLPPFYTDEQHPPPSPPMDSPSSYSTQPIELFPVQSPYIGTAPEMTYSATASTSAYDSPATQRCMDVIDSPQIGYTADGVPYYHSPSVDRSRFASVIDSPRLESIGVDERMALDPSHGEDAAAAAPVRDDGNQAEIPDWIKSLNASAGLDDWAMDGIKNGDGPHTAGATPPGPPAYPSVETVDVHVDAARPPPPPEAFELAALLNMPPPTTSTAAPFPTPTSLVNPDTPIDLSIFGLTTTAYESATASPQPEVAQARPEANLPTPPEQSNEVFSSASSAVDRASASPAPVAMTTSGSRTKGKSRATSAKRMRAGDDDGSKRKRKPKEGFVGPLVEVPLDADTPEGVYTYQVQSASCHSKRYDGQHKCFQCIARNIGHGCCFQEVRSFGVDNVGTIVEAGKFRNTLEPDDYMQYTRPFNTPFTAQHGDTIRTAVAPHVVAILERELAHASNPATKRLRNTVKSTHICDTCQHTSVGGEWMCTVCGRACCHHCRAEFGEIQRKETADGPAGLAIAQASHGVEQQRRKKCVSKKRGTSSGVETHALESFTPVTWNDTSALEASVAQAKAWVAAHPSLPPVAALPAGYYARDPLLPSEHPVMVIPVADFTQQLFHQLWEKGAPIVVDQIDVQYVGAWTPQFFAAQFADVKCDLLNHKSQEVAPSVLSYFFGMYGQAKPDSRSWKLKNFPENGFASCPNLLESYIQAIPLGDLLQPDGVLNLLAHTPINVTQPELGPRSSFSWAGRGSTMLHMEVTDTLNLMSWSTKTATDVPGSARYDIFRAEDAEAIRTFIFEQLSKRMHKGISGAKYRETHDDPLLAENFYLDPNLRHELFTRYGIKPFTVWQRPGQFVVIPAGCAYQVSNYDDCLNIASSFLSRESVGRGLQVYDNSRRATKERVLWRSDTTQLESQLLWSWRAVDELENPAPVPPPPSTATEVVDNNTTTLAPRRANKKVVKEDYDYMP